MKANLTTINAIQSLSFAVDTAAKRWSYTSAFKDLEAYKQAERDYYSVMDILRETLNKLTD